MSDHLVPHPPTSPTSPTSPSGGRPRTRTPWLVAVAAGAVALAAVTALVVVLVAGEAESTLASSERGFDSTAEAVTFMVERLAAGEAGEAVEPLVAGYSFEAQADRLRAVTFQTWLPGGPGGYDEVNEAARRGEVAVALRSLIRSILTPERDQTAATVVSDDLTAQELAAELSPEPLSELALVRTDEIDRSEAAYVETLEQQAAIYGADEVRTVAMLLDTAEGQVMGGAMLVRYADEWSVMSLTAPLLDVPVGQVVPVSEQDYLDAVASARGSDG